MQRLFLENGLQTLSGGGNNTFRDQILADLNRLANNDKSIGSAFEAGLGLSGIGSANTSPNSGFFYDGSLGRVNEVQDPRQALLLDKLQADLGGVRRDEETNRALTQLFSTQRSPIFDGALSEEIIDGMRRQISSAKELSPDEQLVLERRRAGLDGLTAPENTALRERAQEDLDRSFQTNLRFGMAANNLAGRAGGANAELYRDLSRDSLQANRGLSRDIMLANIDERNRRLNEFQGLATGLSDRTFGRQSETRNQLGNLLLNRDVASAQSKLSAADTLNRNLLDRQRFTESSRANRYATFGNTLFASQQDALNRRLLNLGQLAKEKQGQIGILFGAGQFGAAQDAQNRSFGLSESGLNSINSFEIPEFEFPEFLRPEVEEPKPVDITPERIRNEGRPSPF